MLNIDAILIACDAIDDAISKPVEDVKKQNAKIMANLDIITNEVTELPDNYVFVCQKGKKENISENFMVSFLENNEKNVSSVACLEGKYTAPIYGQVLYTIIARIGLENFENIFKRAIELLVQDGYLEEKEGAENE